MSLSEKQKQTLLKLARVTIAEKLGIDYSQKKSDLDLDDPFFEQKRGAFVTLHKNASLRGCIGYISGVKNMIKTIEDMALSAGFNDPRFPSLSSEEFELIDIEISILTPITPVLSVDEIEVGRDGLIISRGYSSGLLLPQVPVEQGWDRETFLNHTCMKAGLPPHSWREEETKIEKFSAEVFGEKE